MALYAHYDLLYIVYFYVKPESQTMMFGLDH